MTLRLADDVVISIGSGWPVRLRASLRAAIRLERQHGFVALLNGVAEANFSIMRSIITEASVDDPAGLLEAIEFEALGKVLPALQAPLMQLVEALIGLDDDDTEAKPSKDSSSDKPFSWSAHFQRLFEIGTGWLGWSPADTLDATPGEILAAFAGRQGMFKQLLQAVFGDGEEADPEQPKPYVEATLDPVTGEDVEFDRAGLQALKRKFQA